jgi:hypothetical protein
MRYWTLLPLCLAACSGGDDAGKEKAQGPAADTVEAGQWETSAEVTSFRSKDPATPAVKAAVGDKATGSACVAKGEEAKPDPALFAGDGYQCTYKSSYIRKGRLNASLRCKRDGITGDILMTVLGTYTGTTFEGTVDTITYLPAENDGDFEMSRKIGGRKTGDVCQAPAAAKA